MRAVTTRAVSSLGAVAALLLLAAGCSSGDDDDSGAVSASPTAASGAAAPGTTVPPLDQPVISGHGQVIAQRVVELGDDPRQWRVASSTLPTGGAPTELPDSLAIVVADSGALEVVEPERTTRLGPGEAAVVAEGAGATAVVPGPDDAAVWTIELSSGDGDGLVGEPFAPLAGANDVELHRDVLAPGELFPMTSHGTPALVLVTAGAVEVAAEGTTTPLPAGTAATFSGDMAITNTGAGDFAAVVVATLTPPDGVEPAPAPPPPSGTEGGVATVATVAPTTPPDRDEDGLSDADEEEFGTDPDNPDSEGDHVNDGDEVHEWGTDPLDNDSDDDFLTDGDEVNITDTDPTDPDTDDDGLGDSDENPNGADPNDPDTDGDGANDGAEVAAGTNPADPTSTP